jgi:hypothetical protein
MNKRKERWQTHVYLTEEDFIALKEIADKESRSTTMQIEYFLRKAIAEHKALEQPIGAGND